MRGGVPRRVRSAYALIALGLLSSACTTADEPLAAELDRAFSLARGERAVIESADLKVELVDVGSRSCPDPAACGVSAVPYAVVRVARASSDATLYAGDVSVASSQFPHFADEAREPYGVVLYDSDGNTSASLAVHGAQRRCTLFNERREEAQCWAGAALYTQREELCARIAEPGMAQGCLDRLTSIKAEQPIAEPPLPTVGIAEIGIERGDCFGTCPVYSLTFRSDGTFRYEGQLHVSRIGKFSGTVDPRRFTELAQFVEDVAFMDLESSYAWNATDQATVITTVVADGVRKSVRNYGRGGPATLEDLEERIDAALVDARWDATPQPVTR